jgi:transposase
VRFVRQASPEEDQELERMIQQEVGRVAMRAHMIQLSARGYTVPQIKRIHATTEVTIYQWFDRFDAEGPAGLYDRPRSGRPPEADAEVKEALEEALSQPPTELGYNFTYWTLPLLGRYLQQTLDKILCHETIRTTLHELGFRWRRPRWAVMDEDPEAKQRMCAIMDAVFAAAADTLILVEDETIFKTLPPLRRMWMRQGQQVRIPTPPSNQSFALYGALEIYQGDWVTGDFAKANSQATVTFLQQLLDQYPQRRILLIWDQAKFHTSHQVENWIADHDRLQVRLLPKRAPEENPVEDIWLHLKDQVAANLTRTLDSIKAACERTFRQLGPEGLFRLAGLEPIS